MTWVLLIVIAGFPFRVEGYTSGDACNAAIKYAKERYYDANIRTVQGYCIPGPDNGKS